MNVDYIKITWNALANYRNLSLTPVDWFSGFQRVASHHCLTMVAVSCVTILTSFKYIFTGMGFL